MDPAEAAAADAALLEAALATPAGAKKDTAREMAKSYNPRLVEAAWYSWWEQAGYFTPRNGSSKPKFVVVIPPPNVTGALHIGHALTNSIQVRCSLEHTPVHVTLTPRPRPVQDTIVRWRRMCGYEALWVPGACCLGVGRQRAWWCGAHPCCPAGTDHAGIATQTVVEKKLVREKGITRQQLGREAFLREVFAWKEQYGNTICSQLRRLGSSLDWSRERFTMDAMLSEAVQEAFIQLHAKGLIYRENRLVNWCCALKTAISDIEVDYLELTGRTQLKVPGHAEPVEFGVITSFGYPLDGGDGEIVVATTRPETMLGDTAVAVHPDDPRYTHLHGRSVVHPFSGRKIPIITDGELVDMAFGTGAVKITPAHDPNDFATGKRHGLHFINIFTEDGRINETGGAPFTGLLRFEARTAVVAALQAKGLLRGTADNPMRLGLCSRSKDVIEPVMKPQWWVSCTSMAAAAAEAARSGDLTILPPEQNATWFRWLDGIRDWCVSRQLWWGHRIPAWYVHLEGEDQSHSAGGPSEQLDRWVVARDAAGALAAAQARFPGRVVTAVTQDEDVLDTWLSSGLFPFSVFGWPNATVDLRDFYPTSLLETGHDILFFWVARMVMLGIQLTGVCPFKQVYLHAMVRDAHGRKMSKSLGNVIDPVHVIEGISLEKLHATLEGGNLDPSEVAKAKAGQVTDFPDGLAECGTDALRFALVAYTTQGRDINLDINRVVGYRHWCNKLWNATRFAMMNLGPGFVPTPQPQTGAFPLRARWILSRLNAAAGVVNASMERYDFAGATSALYSFWQYELCDVYIELVKPVTSAADVSDADKRGTLEALYLAMEAALRLLHPFMPFVTEELWQRLPRSTDIPADVDTIMLAPFPQPLPAWADPDAEADMEQAQAVIRGARSLRNAYGLLPKARTPVFILCRTDAAAESAQRTATDVRALSSGESVTVLREAAGVPPGCSMELVNDAISVYISLKGAVDAQGEINKLHKKLELLAKSLGNLQKQAAAPDYEAKVPPNVRADNADKAAKLATEIAAAEKGIQDFTALL